MKSLSLSPNLSRTAEGNRISLVDVPTPNPNQLDDGHALIRVELAGICGTDLSILDGYRDYQGILGHEFVGRVEAVSDTDASAPTLGARVVGEINISCHGCAMCVRGLSRHCMERKVLGIEGCAGCFAEFIVLPYENLHRVPESIPSDRAVWTEPLAAALAVLETRPIDLDVDEPALVLGDGRLGVLIATALQASGQAVRLRGKHPARIARAEALGIVIDSDGVRPDYGWVIEATGRSEGIEIARAFARPRSTIVLKSTGHGPSQVETARLVVDELRVVGSRCGDFEPALELLKTLHLEELVDEVLPLERGVSAMSKVRDGAFKILLRP